MDEDLKNSVIGGQKHPNKIHCDMDYIFVPSCDIPLPWNALQEQGSPQQEYTSML